jgi:hypothetical protein
LNLFALSLVTGPNQTSNGSLGFEAKIALVNKVSRAQLHRNMDIYVDNMLVKGMTFEQHLYNL